MFFLIIFSIYFNSVSSQSLEKGSVHLNSLEGKPVTVNVELDNVNDKIMLKLNSSEILCISGYRDLAEKIKIINEKFILLHYKIRGGSGYKMEKFVLVSISKGKLIKSMDILSMQSYELKHTYDKETDSLGLYDESGIYKIGFITSKNIQDSHHQIEATQYEKIKSKHDPTKNYETLDTLRLSFDDKNKVFYTEYKTLKGNFIFDGVSQKQRAFKGEKYPLIKLKNDEYLFINMVWYRKVNKNHFVEASFICN